MEEGLNINENNKKKLELFLLYGQALDIHRSYYQEFGQQINKDQKKQYYLIDKTWLDKYKSDYNYDSIIPEAENYQYDDYQTFKSKIMDKFHKNNNKKALKISYPKAEEELISDYGVMLPKNFVIVKKEIFESYFLNYIAYDVIIGERNIFILDKKRENTQFDNLFICSIKYDDYSDDITNFNVNVDYILIFYKEFTVEEKGMFFELIKNGKGINNYFKIKNLKNHKNYGEHIIFGNYNQKVGFLFTTKNYNSYLEEKKISEKFLNEYIDKVNPKRATELILNSNDEMIISKNSMQNHNNNNNSKCITIYGDLYYYLKDDNDDNCQISEYSNIYPNY